MDLNNSDNTITWYNLWRASHYYWISIFCCGLWTLERAKLGLEYNLDSICYRDYSGFGIYCGWKYRGAIPFNGKCYCHLLSVPTKCKGVFWKIDTPYCLCGLFFSFTRCFCNFVKVRNTKFLIYFC